MISLRRKERKKIAYEVVTPVTMRDTQLASLHLHTEQL